jgi:hypothetical protein
VCNQLDQIESTANRSWLTIKHVYPEDAGIFSVKAENKAGSAKSTANLLVSSNNYFLFYFFKHKTVFSFLAFD